MEILRNFDQNLDFLGLWPKQIFWAIFNFISKYTSLGLFPQKAL